jgi:quinol monooxygenase YgiN
MRDEPLTAMGIIRAKTGQERELGRRMAGLVGPTRAEPGCLAYDLFQSIDDSGVWILIERWRSVADLEAHVRADHMAAFLAHGDEVLADHPQNFRLRSTETIAEPKEPSSGAVK